MRRIHVDSEGRKGGGSNVGKRREYVGNDGFAYGDAIYESGSTHLASTLSLNPRSPSLIPLPSFLYPVTALNVMQTKITTTDITEETV